MSGTWRLIRGLTAALVSGGLLALSGGLHPLWWAAWIAPTPVLIAAFRSGAWTGLGLAFVASGIGSLPLFLYVASVTPPVVAGAVVGVTAMLFATGVRLTADARARLPSTIALFAFPVWVAGVETLTAELSPHGTSGSLAYSQMNFVPALQVASLGGSAAVTFVVSLFASALAFALADPLAWRRNGAGLVAALALTGLSLGWGAWRVGDARQDPLTTVALAAIDQGELPEDWRSALTPYRPRIAEAAANKAEILVLPEEVAVAPVADERRLTADLGAAARAARLTLVAGFRLQPATGRAHNRLYLFTPDGRTLTYDKRHLIPGLESAKVEPSSNPVLTAYVGGRRLGGAICKDFDFPEIGRTLSLGGARLAVAPAWDFGADGWLHARMAMLRAVEGGFSLVRSGRDGLLSVSDRYGRVIAQAPSGPSAPLLLARAPLTAEGPTLYARIGDLFGWACLAAAALFITIRVKSAETLLGRPRTH